MNGYWVGPLAAGVTVAAIGFGHVLVRRLHARWGTRPAGALFFAAALTMAAACRTTNDLASALAGLVAVTLFWDGVELYRQEKRRQREKAKAHPQGVGDAEGGSRTHMGARPTAP